MAIKSATKAAIAKKKTERLTEQALVDAVAAKKSGRDGSGLVSILPENDYVLSDMEYIDDEFTYVKCSFMNPDEKVFHISLSACLNAIYDANGNDINQFDAFGVDNIGDTFSVTHATEFGFRPIFDADGQWVPATDKGYKFFSESRGEHFKGRKTVPMICNL